MAEDLFGIVGTVIASAYHVEHVVAEGGFGIVYRARHGGFRAPVALKCLKVPQHLGAEQQRRFVEQFRAEGELMFRLSASMPNVVRPLHVDVMNTKNGAFVPFMVLEWLEGDTLDAIVRARSAAGKRPLSFTEVFELLEPAARALARAHDFNGPAGSESIAHCDVKPENVFVASAAGERIVKILDFGVAKVRGAATRAASGTGGAPELALFTPAYGAPEQWNPRAFGETGPWTDVWGLGLTLVETLVGHPVIAGDQRTMMGQALDPARRPTPGAHGLALGDALEAVFARALALDPRERYADAGVFWRALKNAAARPIEIASVPAPEIPDLVPIPRRPSGAQKLDLGPARPPSGAQKLELSSARSASGARKLELPTVGGLDFDDDSAGEGSGIALDLPADELVHKGSLAPLPPPPAPAISDPALGGPLSARSGHLTSPGQAFSSSPQPPAEPPPASLPQPIASAALPPAHISQALPPLGPQSPAAANSPAKPAPASSLQRKPALPEPEPPLSRRLVPGLAIAASSIALTVLDRVYAAVQGEVFSLGPLRTSWIAAALLLIGLGLAAKQFVPRS